MNPTKSPDLIGVHFLGPKLRRRGLYPLFSFIQGTAPCTSRKLIHIDIGRIIIRHRGPGKPLQPLGVLYILARVDLHLRRHSISIPPRCPTLGGCRSFVTKKSIGPIPLKPVVNAHVRAYPISVNRPDCADAPNRTALGHLTYPFIFNPFFIFYLTNQIWYYCCSPSNK